MLQIFWHEFLFRPVFNLLIFLYNTISFYNLGIAVIYLTIIIRILLLPFSIIGYRGKEFYEKLSEKIKEIDKDYGTDYVKKKEMVRLLLKRNQINPWSQIIVLGAQVLILILLYQVFISGITKKETLNALYTPYVQRPDFINTWFIWFDIGKTDWAMSALTGFVLFLEISLAQRVKKSILTRKDQIFKILFPAFTVVALGILPAVKSIFILTSILFSIIMIIVVDVILESLRASNKKKKESKPKINLNDITIKRI